MNADKRGSSNLWNSKIKQGERRISSLAHASGFLFSARWMNKSSELCRKPKNGSIECTDYSDFEEVADCRMVEVMRIAATS
jgi:hypothetical protein